MADIPANLLPRLQTWWGRLEGGTQAIFETIYMEAPAAVSRAVSGGEWVADGPEPGLAEQLGTDFRGTDAEKQIPQLYAQGALEITPFHAQIGQKVMFKWTEANSATVPLGPYVTDIYVTDQNGEQVGAARLDGDGVPAGGTVERTWEFPGGASAGTYTVVVYLNAEGSDPGDGVAGPQGYRGATNATFDVGASEGAAAGQDMAAWGSATVAFQGASAYAGMPAAGAELLTRLREGVNWMAAVDGLTPEEQRIAGQFGAWVEGIAHYLEEGNEEFIEAIATNLATVGGMAARSPSGSTPEARQPLFDALKALANIS